MVIRRSTNIWKWAKIHIHLFIEVFEKLLHNFCQILNGLFYSKKIKHHCFGCCHYWTFVPSLSNSSIVQGEREKKSSYVWAGGGRQFMSVRSSWLEYLKRTPLPKSLPHPLIYWRLPAFSIPSTPSRSEETSNSNWKTLPWLTNVF